MLIRPKSLADALDALVEHGSTAHLLAGGQSLIPMMSAGLVRPAVLIDIASLAADTGFELDDEDVVVRLGCTHADLEHPGEEVDAAAPVLAKAAAHIANSAVRNRGTFLGSLAHADPSGEWPAVSMAVDARIEISSRRGVRRLDARDFFLGPLMTAIEPDEMVTEARWKRSPQGPDLWSGGAVEELAYRQSDYAIVGVVAQLSIDDQGDVQDPRIVVFGLGDVPVRLLEVERALQGANDSAFSDAGADTPRFIEAISDASASAHYRKRVSGVMVRRALNAAYAGAMARYEADLKSPMIRR